MDKTFAAKVSELLIPDVGHLAEHLEYVRRAGHELPGEPVPVAHAISAFLCGFAQSASDGSTGLTEEQAVDVATDLLHRGVAGRAP